MKKAILTVSFGTTFESSLRSSIEALENDIRSSFPDHDVFRAFTSSIVMKRLRERNIVINSVSDSLKMLSENGYETVMIQPTHIISGNEYDKMCSVCEEFRGRFTDMKIGVPLFSSESDMEYVCRFFENEFGNENAVAFMGHGTDHAANRLYQDFEKVCRKLGFSNMFIGTVEGTPDINGLICELKKAEYKNVIVTPLMLVAGDHAHNDMAGEDEDSWVNRLTAEGFSAAPVLKGLGEYAEIRSLYTAHLKATIGQ